MHLTLMLRAGFLALLVSLIAMLALPARAQTPGEPALISISGTGSVNAVPDIAHVTSGVVSEAKTARDALGANNADMARVIETLKAAGIEARDIATAGFNISPVYSSYRPKPGEEARPPRVVGYRVSNAVNVRIRDLDKVGPVLDQLVSDGANTVDGIRFAIDDDAALLDEARKAAVADAMRKAKILTEAAGVRLGRIVSIGENQFSRPPQPMLRMARAEAAMDAAVPVEAGEQTLRVEVSITWEIRQ